MQLMRRLINLGMIANLFPCDKGILDSYSQDDGSAYDVYKGGEFMAAEDEVRKASEQFYTALNRMLNGEAGPLADIWSHSAGVTTMHPIGGREVGWEKVRQSWEQVAQIASEGQVKLGDQFIQVVGDVGYELGAEQGQVTFAGQQVTIEHRVTNIYRREAGAWKIVHHHTDVSPAMQDVLSNTSKVMVDVDSGNSLMYLPLDQMVQGIAAVEGRRGTNDRPSATNSSPSGDGSSYNSSYDSSRTRGRR